MTVIKPFKAIRPAPAYVRDVSAPPYDVVSVDEVRKKLAENERSFFAITRSEGMLPPGEDPYGDTVYQQAKDNLARFLAAGLLTADSDAALFVYREEMGSHVQIGIVGCVSVDEYERGLIRVHEKTRSEKELDRTRHMLVTRTHSEPVFLAYRERSEITALLATETERTPLYDFTAEDGVRHTLWKAARSGPIVEAFQEVPSTYIADGHHRAASSQRVCAELRRKNPRHTGNEEYNFFPAVIFPHTQLKILPYNRIIRRLSKPPQTLLAELHENFEIGDTHDPAPKQKGEIAMYLDGRWRRLHAFTGDEERSALDVDVLYRQALAPVFGIGDPRTDKNIDFVGGIRGTDELQRLVDSGEAACAFSMYPVSIDDIFAVADRGGDHASQIDLVRAEASVGPLHACLLKDRMGKKSEGEGQKAVALNKKARFSYEIVETFEAGLVLTGAEIKSIREGGISISESYVRPQDGELYLLQAHIKQYTHSHDLKYEPERKRKLLMHKHEIEKLSARVEAKGFTLVPLKIYLKRGRAKLELALARGKAAPDKRVTIRERELDREASRAMKKASR